LLIDRELFEVQFFKEWGYSLGDDACLFEDDRDSEASQPDNEIEHGDPEASNNVDMLVDKLTDEMEEGGTHRLER
jgi:hypothetical protein